ncbi:MAG: helix-turn-helix transcriptional regulator, partial [bacterium]|nr:helix-turn-helix transcriptional regulator [bacterium]
QFRESLGLNRSALAKTLGITAAKVSNIESGKTVPVFSNLLFLHREYRLNLNWLLTGEEPMCLVTSIFIPEKYAEMVRLMQVPEVEQFIFSQLAEIKSHAGAPYL